MAFRYTQKMLNFLKVNFPKMMVADLTEAFNQQFNLDKTPGQIKSTLKNHDIQAGRKPLTKGRLITYTDEQVQWLRDNRPSMDIHELTHAFNAQFNNEKTTYQIGSLLKRHKITNGRSTQFKKGHVPWSKGTKGICKPNAGSFKKGSKPVNTKPISHERICKKDGYILVKTDQVNPYTGAQGWYRHKHLVIWEQAHGPIPDGYLVRFKDGNRLNCELDNLQLIDKASHTYLNRNGYNDLPDDVKPAMVNLAKVTTKMKQLERQ